MNELQGRLPELPDRRDILITAHTYEQLARLVRRLTVVNGSVGVNALGGLELTMPDGNGGGGGGGGGGYDGPFAVSVDSGNVTIAAGNIIAGTSTIAFPQTVKTNAGAGTVYLALTYSGGSYSYAVAIANLPPTQSATTAIFRLARVPSAAPVVQYQYGDIYVAGRVV